MDQIALPGDFDGDGHPDVLARRSADGALMLYRGDGKGGWRGSTKVGHGWNVMDTIFSPGDFDGDGRPDIIARRSDDASLVLYRGNGGGGWRGSKQIGHGWRGMDAIFSVGDFDRDGAADVVARRASDNALMLYRGNNRGGWRGAVKIGHNWEGLSLPGVWESTASQPIPDAGPLPKPTPPPQTRNQPFVYGTLRTGQRGYEMILKGKTTSEPKTTVSARSMYTKVGGACPYSVPPPAAMSSGRSAQSAEHSSRLM